MRFSHSRISTFKTCPKRYWWVYNQNLIPKEVARPLELGDLVHTSLALHHLNREEEAKAAVEHDPEAFRLYNAYLSAYPTEPFTVIATEHFTEAEILPGITYIIKGDKLIRFRQLLMLMEHKTSAKDDSRTINSHVKGPQITGYIWGLSIVLKEKIHGCLWDFIIKTKIPGFRRIPQLYSTKDLDVWVESTQHWITDIIECHERNLFKRNLSACYVFMGECPYIPVCRLSDTPEVRTSLYNKREEVNPTKRLERKEVKQNG